MNLVSNAVEKMNLKLSRFQRTAQTILLKKTGASNIKRWADQTNLSESWDGRTQMLATFVQPGSTVLEFGAGRMVLPRYLPEGCVYLPSDIVDRGNNTFVCDLNAAQLPPFPVHDVALFSGVLEYVNDLPRLLAHLAHYGHSIVASYAVTDFAHQKSTISRRKHGWVNDYSSAEIQELFAKHNFQRDQMALWADQQYLFRFVKLPKATIQASVTVVERT